MDENQKERQEYIRPTSESVSTLFYGDFEESFKIEVFYIQNDTIKTIIYALGVLLSGGLLYLFQRWSLALVLKVRFVKSHWKEATHVLVKKTKNGISIADDQIVILQEDTLENKQVRQFYYEHLKFYITEEEQLIQLKASFDHLTNNQIHTMIIGLDSKTVIQRINTYGKNIMDIEIKNYLELLIDEVLTPFNIFQIFAIALWSYDSYLYYAMLILFLTIVQMIVALYTLKKELLKVRNMIAFKTDVEILRDGEFTKLSSDQLVFGDIYKVQSYSKLPCDCIILQGSCVVNEAILTGESIPISKTSLPNNPIHFSPKGNESALLYSGTSVLKSDAVAIVYKTAFSTAKGSLARSIIFSKSTTFSFEQDSRKYLILLGLLGILLAAIAVWMQYDLGNTTTKLVVRALEVFTIIIPPALPTALAAGITLSITRLKHKSISCVKTDKVNVAGIINVCAFDKTGTLTELGLDVLGFRPRKQKGFGKQDLVKNASGDLLELFVSCHSLLFEFNTLQGDPLDLSMFNATEWEFQGDSVQKGQSSVGILKRFDFLAELQRMSVIAKTNQSIKLFTKGSPEVIKSICTQETLPENYDQVLQMYSTQGYRVIACAYKTINEQESRMQRKELEQKLQFLGFLIFENKIKSQTTQVIKDLQQAKLKTLMVTGDNVYTAINISQQCDILNSYQNILIGEVYQGDIRWKEIAVDNKNKMNEEESYHNLIQLEDKFLSDTPYNCQLVISGQVFQFVFDNYSKRYSYILENTKVYARMKPNNKGDLMTLLQQQKDTYVCFCGDGTNDTCALRQADIGLALSQEEASLAAPFSSTILNITGVLNVLTEGRAAIVTSIECFKFLTVYAILQTIAVIYLYINDDDFSQYQYLYSDFWLIVPMAFTMTLNRAMPKLADYRPCSNLISLPVISSLTVLCGICVGSQALVRWYFMDQQFYIEDETEYQTDEVFILADPINTMMIIVVETQILAVAIAYTQGPPFRETVLKNFWFMLCCVIAFVVHLLLILYPDSDVFTYIWLSVYFPYDMRTYLIGICFCIATIIICYEKGVTAYITKVLNRQVQIGQVQSTTLFS